MDRLIEQSPPIPKKILTAFDKEFPDDNIFRKPEILHIHPIMPFKAIKEYSIMSLLKDPTQVMSQNELKDELDELRGRVMPGQRNIEDPFKKTGIRRRMNAAVETITKKVSSPKEEVVEETDVESATQGEEEE
jgi:hypothetical protein